MLKKRRLFIFLLVIIAASALAFYLIQPKTVIQNELSDRALRYIEKKEGEFENVNLTPKVKRVNEKLVAEGCFSFVLPFDLTTFREQDDCSFLYNFQDPIGRVVIRYRDISVSNLDDVPDVRLRKDRESYEMSEENVDGKNFYVFEKNTEGYELSAFSLEDGKLLTVSLTSQINRGLMEEFVTMLRSIETY